MTLTIAGTLMRKGGFGVDRGELFGAVLDVHSFETDNLTVEDRVPIDLDHNGKEVGQLVHIERTEQGDIHIVGVVERCDELADLEGDIFLSPELWCRQSGSDTAWIGKDPHLLSVALTRSPQQICLHPITILPGDVAKSYARGYWPWAQRSRPLMKRAAEATATLELRRAPLTLLDLTPPPLDDPGTLRMPLEVRSAPTLDVVERRRTIEVLAAPAGQEATVIIRGKVVGERFARNAFAGDEHRAHRVKVNRDHQAERTVGKAVTIDPYSKLGCVATLQISRTALGDETLALAEDRVLDCSVGFRVRPGGEEWDAARTRRTVTRGELDHIALLPDPAYEGANILDVRSHR